MAYIHALRFSWLTSLYDPVVRWTTREATFKRRLVAEATVENGQRILDLGCGTGTLAILLKRAVPGTEVVGLDGDVKILDIARTKAEAVGVDIAFDEGMSFELPYPANSFDRVVSTLLFHHLTREAKHNTLAEVFRVLKPGGELHVGDWGMAQNGLMRGLFAIVQLLDGFETTADNVEGRLPEFFREAGFNDVRVSANYATALGTISLYAAVKPKS
ncbi:MAG: class I SAM-dependent methyltransferase [Proteobacteria bacterium]|nr:class I SAM-dependent methyltransferase [Pseudomonadota bacterium]